MKGVSNRVGAAAKSVERIHQLYLFSRYAERRAKPGICDFTFGNPHETPPSGLVEAIRHHVRTSGKRSRPQAPHCTFCRATHPT
jgi:aspartate aminotransferase